MERWKDVIGFEGLYKVSDDGKIYSIKKNIILKPKLTKDGYYEVCLYNGTNNHRRVHRIVAQAFVEMREGCNIVNHLDSNKLNNHYSNLEWTTVKGNTIHAYYNNKEFHDRVQSNWRRGTEKKKIKLDVYLNEKYIGSFNSKTEAAKILNISEKTIYNRLHNKFSSKSGYEFVRKEVI